ncbi:MAG: HAMP domain-containing sensor histidine kinase, partial [Acidobacteriota bacterium]
LDVSRVITGKLQLQIEPVDLRAVALAALDTLRLAAEAKGVRLEASVEKVPRLNGDAQRLQQVFWNLIANAVKFTATGGVVSFVLAAAPGVIRITVSDNGAGIPSEVLPYIFDRFTQGDSSSTRTQPGLGLGLAIVRYLVELHGGTVTAQSAGSGAGATFRVSLPLAPAGS